MMQDVFYTFGNAALGLKGSLVHTMRVMQNQRVYNLARRPTATRDDAWWLWLTTALGILGLIEALAGSSRGAFMFLAVWGGAVCLRTHECRILLFRTPMLWLVPGMALASVMWSQAPGASLRAATELGLTVAIASLTAGLVRPRAFVSAMLICLLLGAADCLMFGQMGTDGLSGTTVFLGVFGSKNTLAMFMSFLAIFAAVVLIDGQQPRLLRLVAVLAFILSVPLLIRAHSAGAAVTTIISFIIMGLTMLFARMQARERMLTLICMAIIGIPLLLAAIAAALDGTLATGFNAFISGVLGKDPTLTGRTVLWHIALAQIQQRPMLGLGYAAFWIQGNLLPEGIWRAFQIDNRMGFTFHDTYLEAAVELGWVGAAALVLTLARTLVGAVRLALVQKSWPAACFVTIIVCLLSRSAGEVDLPYPFAITTYVFFVIAAYGADFARGTTP